ncbi:MAG TPA: histidine kinase [Solirubrobacteraceae bacterium]|jgi:signal transduction histidine kinase
MGRLAAIDARLRTLPADRVLAACAVLLAVTGALEMATAAHPGTRGVAVVFAVLLTVPLTFAWRAPLGALLAFDGLALLEAALGGRVFNTSVSVALLLIAYVLVLALRAERTAFAIGVAATIGLLMTASELEHDSGSFVDNAAWLTLIPVGMPAICGRVLRSRNDLNRRLHEQADELERNRSERERAAVLGERTRIARELHDIVAHDVSVMLVQAQGAHRTALTDPERARSAIAAVEETGREALGELRRLLGVLRRGDEELALAPQPSLARLATLVERIRAAGLAVDLDVSGERLALAPGIDAAAYRIVQEALTNVVQRGGASRAAVHVAYETGAIELVVSDDGALRDGGGIVALRERVSLYGGELHAGRSGEDFELRARLPVTEAA